ncbi:50S ribosomal protein L4 [Candidatus Liberibacter solanacearum]|uniref:Large ribosomal subunit protein uL4 n=1 Tax=Candidatus Liberibacter solanacearum TaxID=556287 RepID=A0A424FLK0_9HYPH|nr:50S ribosomal protein L4 [Candidatus Liberibacter solanacearum]RPD37039.1 50S ribosomal protein L4 [Candidatus Liberibacter solanacearum]
MIELSVRDLDGADKGVISVSEGIFALKPQQGILARVLRWQSWRRSKGCSKSKGRSEIAYTGAKMYTQKGTGRARHSSKSAPQFRGGGKAFGPVPGNGAHDLPKKIRSLALRHALSDKFSSNDILVIDSLVSKELKTKYLAERFRALNLSNALIIDGVQLDRNFQLAARNIPNINLLPVQGINVYDILRCSKLILSKSAVEALEGRFK